MKGIDNSGIVASSASGTPLNIAIVHTRWNKTIVDALSDKCESTLKEEFKCKVSKFSVPGCYELPFTCAQLLKGGKKFDAVVAVGVLIKGETMHFEYIAESVSHGLMRVQLDFNDTPVIFGVLTCVTEDQAKARAGLIPGAHNHGESWAYAAIEMIALQNNIKRTD